MEGERMGGGGGCREDGEVSETFVEDKLKRK